MHSSRMQTAHLFTILGGSASRGLPKPEGICIWGGVCIKGGLPKPRGGLHPGGSASRGSGQPRGVCIQGGLGRTPVNRMTHRCKNITLHQTSFAGGNQFFINKFMKHVAFVYEIKLASYEKALSISIQNGRLGNLYAEHDSKFY